MALPGLAGSSSSALALAPAAVWMVSAWLGLLLRCRDLKLDNTLLDHHQPGWIKLCDFGFAKHWNANSNMDTMRIGTPEYMGPELISSRQAWLGSG